MTQFTAKVAPIKARSASSWVPHQDAERLANPFVAIGAKTVYDLAKRVALARPVKDSKYGMSHTLG